MKYLHQQSFRELNCYLLPMNYEKLNIQMEALPCNKQKNDHQLQA